MVVSGLRGQVRKYSYMDNEVGCDLLCVLMFFFLVLWGLRRLWGRVVKSGSLLLIFFCMLNCHSGGLGGACDAASCLPSGGAGLQQEPGVEVVKRNWRRRRRFRCMLRCRRVGGQRRRQSRRISGVHKLPCVVLFEQVTWVHDECLAGGFSTGVQVLEPHFPEMQFPLLPCVDVAILEEESEKGNDFLSYQQRRAEEIEAISKAMEILSGGAGLGAAEKRFSSQGGDGEEDRAALGLVPDTSHEYRATVGDADGNGDGEEFEDAFDEDMATFEEVNECGEFLRGGRGGAAASARRAAERDGEGDLLSVLGNVLGRFGSSGKGEGKKKSKDGAAKGGGKGAKSGKFDLLQEIRTLVASQPDHPQLLRELGRIVGLASGKRAQRADAGAGGASSSSPGAGPVQAMQPDRRPDGRQSFYSLLTVKVGKDETKPAPKVRKGRLLPSQQYPTVVSAALLLAELDEGRIPVVSATVATVAEMLQMRALARAHSLSTGCAVLLSDVVEETKPVDAKMVWATTDLGVVKFFAVPLVEGGGGNLGSGRAGPRVIQVSTVPVVGTTEALRVTVLLDCVGSDVFKARGKDVTEDLRSFILKGIDAEIETYGFRVEKVQQTERLVGYIKCDKASAKVAYSRSGIGGFFLNKLAASSPEEGWVEWCAKTEGEGGLDYLARMLASKPALGLAFRSGTGASLGFRRAGKKETQWAAFGVPFSWGPGTMSKFLEERKWLAVADLKPPARRGQAWWFRATKPADWADDEDESVLYQAADMAITVRPWLPAPAKKVVAEAQSGRTTLAAWITQPKPQPPQQVQPMEEEEDAGIAGAAAEAASAAEAKADEDDILMNADAKKQRAEARAEAAKLPSAKRVCMGASLLAAPAASAGSSGASGSAAPPPPGGVVAETPLRDGPDSCRLWDVGGAGDCGYRAIMAGLASVNGADDATTIGQLHAGATSLRVKVAAALRESAAEWGPSYRPSPCTTVEIECGQIPQTAEALVEAVENRPGRWICARALVAAAAALKIVIVVWDIAPNGKWRMAARFVGTKSKTPKVVALALRAQHYFAIRASDMKDTWVTRSPFVRVPSEWLGRGAGLSGVSVDLFAGGSDTHDGNSEALALSDSGTLRRPAQPVLCRCSAGPHHCESVLSTQLEKLYGLCEGCNGDLGQGCGCPCDPCRAICDSAACRAGCGMSTARSSAPSAASCGTGVRRRIVGKVPLSIFAGGASSVSAAALRPLSRWSGRVKAPAKVSPLRARMGVLPGGSPTPRRVAVATVATSPEVQDFETFVLSFKNSFDPSVRVMDDLCKEELKCAVSRAMEWCTLHPAAKAVQVGKQKAVFTEATRRMSVLFQQAGDLYACPCGWRLPAPKDGSSAAANALRRAMARKHWASCQPAGGLYGREPNEEARLALRRQQVKRMAAASCAKSKDRYERFRELMPPEVLASAHVLNFGKAVQIKSNWHYECKRCGGCYGTGDVWRIACSATPPEERMLYSEFAAAARAAGARFQKIRRTKVAVQKRPVTKVRLGAGSRLRRLLPKVKPSREWATALV